MNLTLPTPSIRVCVITLIMLLSGCARWVILPDRSNPADAVAASDSNTVIPAAAVESLAVDADNPDASQAPVSVARAFLDEARLLLAEAETSFEEGDYHSTEFTIKEAQQVLLDADQLVPPRIRLETEEPRTEVEMIMHEGWLRLREEFERLWNAANALYDQLIPYLDISVFETGVDQGSEGVDVEAMNIALEEALETAPGSWQEIRDLLLQMREEERIDIDMGLESYSDAAWKRVYGAVSYYTNRGREDFLRWLERSGRYQHRIEEILVEEGVPRDMIYLCMIESGFSARATSRAGAVGLWQFMSYTAGKYDLQTSRSGGLFDERRDYVLSTRAASAYLKDLYAEFQAWPLAMAAYNSGEGRVRGAQRWAKRNRTGQDYWSIYRRLPPETRNYVPYYLAAMVISKNLARFGFSDVAYQSRFEESYEIIHIEGPLYLKQAAEWVGTDEITLVELNPEIIRYKITPREGYDLRLPKGTTDAFVAALERIPEQPRVSYVTHVIRRGDTGSEIAEKWNISWSKIRQENNIRNDRNLKVGQELRIPRYERSRYLTEQEITSLTRQRLLEGVGTPLRVRVRRGNTISGLATRYGVTWVQIRGWNGLRTNTIYAGQTLTIYPRRTVRLVRAAVSTAGLPADGVYTIGRNDTLWDISRRFSVSVSNLKKWNGLSSNTIYPGRKLIVTEEAARQAGMGGGGEPPLTTGSF